MSRAVPTRPVAALALVVALSLPAAGSIIYDVGVIPSPFSPNADGVFDSTAVYYSLSEQAAVVVSVADSSGSGLWTLWSGWEDPGAHSHWWSGWFGDSLGADGVYQFLIKAIPEEAPYEEATFPFVVDTAAPPLFDFGVAPSRFSPDGDGVGDSLLVSFAAGVTAPTDQVIVSVLDSSDQPVRLVFSATGVGTAAVFWDGRDDAGSVVADGLYLVSVGTRDAAGNSAGSEALADVDTSPPALGVVYESPEDTEFRVNGPVADVGGWAYDRAGVVAVELSLDEDNWTPAGVGRADTVTWTASVECTACVADSLDERLEVFVRAHDGTPTADGQGHVNGPEASIPVLSFDVVFDVAPPAHVSTSVSGGDDTFESGETITLTSMWDDSGYDIAADFSAVDSEFDPGSVSVSEGTGGRYTITYELSQANSLVPVTDAPVVVTATDRFARSVSDTSVTVSVVRSGGTSSGLAVDVNSFRPLNGESAVIAPGSSGAATIEIYNMTGTLVRTLESDDGSPVSWYGDNDDGVYVAAGVYFLMIRTDDGDAVRKVAVIK